jgi:hypothetical protein
MGILIGVGNTKPTFPYDYYYGVKIDTTVADPALERVGLQSLHASLPVQSMMRRCLLNDNGEVVTYLHATDSTKTDTGATADLTGASGMVMVEIPEHYRKFEFDGTTITALISLIQLPGFHKVRKLYRSAYEATVDRTTSTPKLASVVNDTADFRGGNNTAGWDETYRSLLGRPATNISLTNFRTYARNRGNAGLNNKGWNCDLYEAAVNTYWLYVIEYANLNCQAAFTSQLTEQGYHQGGLGDGVTTLDSTKWDTFNSRNPFIPCGITNSLGNRTGVVDYDMPEEYNATTVTVHVPSYRGIENPFGHVWSWTDGLHVQAQSVEAGNKHVFYRAENDDPANFQDSNYNGYEVRGELPRADGYVKKIVCGEYGDIMPLQTGGSSTTYFCDNFYQNIPASGTSLRGVSFGGAASSGASAGLAYAYTRSAPSSTSADLGSRLCFIPAT